MITFLETKSPISIAEILEVEKIAGIKFPEEYKTHLLKYNGGKCEPNVFSFSENGNLTQSCIERFLAICDGCYDSLEEHIDIFKIDEKKMPSNLLPIAYDPGGNLICISCDKEDKGSIYFWDHENEVDYEDEPDDDYSNLYLIATTFEAFLNGLEPAENFLKE